MFFLAFLNTIKIIEKFDFEIWVEEEGNFPTFLGWFWVRVNNVAHVRPSRKMGPKTKICT